MKKKLIAGAYLTILGILPLPAIEQQQQNCWCWAACIQDTLAQGGFYTAQPAIVARLTGWVSNRPASIPEVTLILQSYGFRAAQAGRPGSPQELYQTLATDWKLIAFVSPQDGPIGHFIVLEGIDPVTGMIIVADPWTGVTRPCDMTTLYNGWRWSDSVVVGRPMSGFRQP